MDGACESERGQVTCQSTWVISDNPGSELRKPGCDIDTPKPCHYSCQEHKFPFSESCLKLMKFLAQYLKL